MNDMQISPLINKIAKNWCLWAKYYAKIDFEKDYKKKKKYCEKCELLNEKISRYVTEIDRVFNAVC